MKVKELINKLQQYNLEYEVVTRGNFMFPEDYDDLLNVFKMYKEKKIVIDYGKR
jgi:hypothetical protein